MFKKNALLIWIAVAVAAAQSGVVASSSAQTYTVAFNGGGSSALYLELGQAADGATPNGLGLECLWTGANSATAGLNSWDPTTGEEESGMSWIAWSPSTANSSCSTYASTDSVSVYAYVQLDSVVGNRCLFNGCLNALASGFGTTQKKIYSAACITTGTPSTSAEQCTMPAGVSGLFPALTTNTSAPYVTGTAAQTYSVAGTDIRPEDAYFATVRINTGCGETVGSSQYLGLGYPYATNAAPSTIIDYYNNATTFNVTDFTLPSSYTVDRVGAVPIIVAVNNTDGSGFANTAITDISSADLAELLDGTISSTEDISGITTGAEGIHVLIREPLSGTYNTMEFNDPNTTFNQTSQDVGLEEENAQKNCTGSSPNTNPLNIATTHGTRTRAIGTGQLLNILFGGGGDSTNPFPTGSVIGYGFWSTGNFKGAYTGAAGYNTNARYLTVDDIDPLLTTAGPYASAVSPAASATITAYSASGTDVTFTATNSFTVGELVTLSGLTTVTSLNDVETPVVAATGTTFEVASTFTAGSGTETGGAWLGGLCPDGLCPAGTIPTTANGGIESVTLAHVADGTYPLWSFLRVVCTTNCTGANALAGLGSNFTSFGTASSIPDFVPVNTGATGIVRSHFLPPGIGALGCTLSNGDTTFTTGPHAAPECGGDVGGVVLSIEADRDYDTSFLSTKYVGETGKRR
jgi:hypothetical protein